MCLLTHLNVSLLNPCPKTQVYAKVSDVLMTIKAKLCQSAKKSECQGITEVSHPVFFICSLNAYEHLHLKIFTHILLDNQI